MKWCRHAMATCLVCRSFTKKKKTQRNSRVKSISLQVTGVSLVIRCHRREDLLRLHIPAAVSLQVNPILCNGEGKKDKKDGQLCLQGCNSQLLV